MNAVTVVLLLVLLLILLFLFTKVSMDIHSENFESAFQLRFGLFKINTNKKKTKEEKPEHMSKEVTNEDTEKFIDTLKKYNRLIKEKGRFLFKHVSIDELDLDIRVGSSDAALTALVYGAISAVFYPLLALLKSYCTIRKESINFQADFSSNKLNYASNIRISLKVYEMIAIILVIILWNQKVKKQTA